MTVLNLLERLGRRNLGPVIEIQDRLTALGFPFGSNAGLDPNTWTSNRTAVSEWAADALREGKIAHTSQSDHLARGMAVDHIAALTGVSVLRVFHHIAKAPDEWTAGGDEWRVVREPEAPVSQLED